MASTTKTSGIPCHHVKEKVCTTRPPYREGRDPKAIKVYTVSSESRYLLIQGVPINHGEDLAPIFSVHGEIDEVRGLGDYPEKEDFTEVFLIKYKRIQSARFAKRKLDDLSFFGGCLHVCYAPEYESLAETRTKLLQRRKIIAIKTSDKKVSSENSSFVAEQKSFSEPSTSQPSEHSMLSLQTKPNQFSTSFPSIAPVAPDFSVPPPRLSQPVQPPSPFPAVPSIAPLPPPTTHPPPPLPSHRNPTVHPPLPSPLPPPHPPARPLPPPPPPPTSSHPVRPPQPPPLPNGDTEQYTLAAPPKSIPRKFWTPKGHRTKFQYARVMSSQAMYPAGFDARISPPSTCRQVAAPVKNALESSKCSSLVAKTSESNDHIVNKKQSKVTTKDKKTPLLIRESPKRISVPKLIPRQTAMKMKSVPQKGDQLDKALRAMAVQLGNVQGPALPEELQTVSKELQKSLDETRLKIRKHVSQFSEASQKVGVEKRLKVDE